MYYISDIKERGKSRGYIRVYDADFLDTYEVKFDLYSTETNETIVLDYKDLNESIFGVVQNHVFKVSKLLWNFLDMWMPQRRLHVSVR